MEAKLLYCFGNLQFDGTLLFRGDTHISLRPVEPAVLLLLVANPRTLVTREAIQAVCCPKAHDSGRVDQCIKRLRTALQEPGAPRRGEGAYIATVSGKGYAFVKPVTLLREGSPEALCRLGLASWNYRERDQLVDAHRCYARAMKRDPGFPDAYAGLASCYAIAGSYWWTAPGEGARLARHTAEQALEMAPELPEARATLAFVDSLYEHRWDDAESGFRCLLNRSPSYGVGYHWSALHHAAKNDLSEALREIDTAIEYEPSRSIMVHAAAIRYWARQYDEAEERAASAVELFDDFYYAHYMLGVVQEGQGRFEDAMKSHEEARKRCPDSPMLAAALTRTKALRGISRSVPKDLWTPKARSKRQGAALSHVAMAYAALGDKDCAFEILNAAIDAKDVWVSFLGVDPRLDSLRSDSRFRGLLERLKLTPFVH